MTRFGLKSTLFGAQSAPFDPIPLNSYESDVRTETPSDGATGPPRPNETTWCTRRAYFSRERISLVPYGVTPKSKFFPVIKSSGSMRAIELGLEGSWSAIYFLSAHLCPQEHFSAGAQCRKTGNHAQRAPNEVRRPTLYPS